MPSTVASLLSAAGLELGGSVRWGEPVPETAGGVYLVSLSGSATEIAATQAIAPLSDRALAELRVVCPDLKLDGALNPTSAQLAARIGDYWLTDECVLYIGLTGQALRARVRQYYRTPLGAAKPHKGGWWLKTLAALDELHVYFAATTEQKSAEETMLRAFSAAVSRGSRSALPAGEPVMPFANLRDGDWRRRKHNISGATSAPHATAIRATGGVGNATMPRDRL